MELLSVMARGPAPMGFYEQAGQRTPLKAVRVASDVPPSERTALEVFRTDGPFWAAVLESRRNRREPWYQRPAGHVDLCNVVVPVRPVKAPPSAPAPTSAPAPATR
jgi:peptidylprolyl isomerase